MTSSSGREGHYNHSLEGLDLDASILSRYLDVKLPDLENPNQQDPYSSQLFASKLCPYPKFGCVDIIPSTALELSPIFLPDESYPTQIEYHTPPHSPYRDYSTLNKVATTNLHLNPLPPSSSLKRSKCPSQALRLKNLDYPSVIARRKSTIHAACEELRELLNLPKETSKIDTLHYVIQLITVHRSSYSNI